VADFLGSINPLYSVSGFVVGGLVGFTGVGGGALMTPLLVLLFGIAPTTAVGTDLLYAAITKSGGTLVHARNGTIAWRITLLLAAGSVPATIATLRLLSWLGQSGGHAAKNGFVTTALGGALILAAIFVLFRGWLLEHIAAEARGLSDRRTDVATILLGALLGVMVSATSVGAGSIGMTILLGLYPRMATAKLVGSDIAHAVPLTFVAGMGYLVAGAIDWALLVSLLVGSLPGIAIGSHFVAKSRERYVRPVLAGVLTLVGAKLLM